MNTPDLISLLVGIFSAICWLIADIPQIIHNYKTKSVEGIAPMLFILISEICS